MNRVLTVILSKFFVYFAIGYVTLGIIGGNPMGLMVLFAVIASLVNYLVGDIYIMHQYGNLMACISDGFMAGLTVYGIGLLVPDSNVPSMTVTIAGILAAVVGYLFHIFLFKDKLQK